MLQARETLCDVKITCLEYHYVSVLDDHLVSVCLFVLLFFFFSLHFSYNYYYYHPFFLLFKILMLFATLQFPWVS